MSKNVSDIIKEMDQIDGKIQDMLFFKFDYWAEHVIFSWRWWLGIGLTIIPWLIFWTVFRKKPYMDRLLFVAAWVMIISALLDILGDQYGFWHYRFNVIPAVPTYFPWDYTLMPLSVILLLRIKPKANPLIKAIIFSLLTSFVGEPFFHWIDIYALDKWKYIFSVPIQILIYLFAHHIFTFRNKFEQADS